MKTRLFLQGIAGTSMDFFLPKISDVELDHVVGNARTKRLIVTIKLLNFVTNLPVLVAEVNRVYCVSYFS